MTTIRRLTTIPEYERCLELQREGFGWSDANLMPVRFFVVTNHIGGLLLGAFEDGELAGFLSSIPAVRDGVLYWHSHMLAVARNHRSKGIGASLKFAQREYAIQQGISSIEWTFDPLLARNAYFNFQKLGVIVRRYYPNFYGDGGDRVVAEWRLDGVREAIRGDVRRVAIHSDMEALQKLDIQSARNLQQRVANEFQRNLAENFHAIAFESNPESCEYVFVRGASGVHPEG